MPLVEYVRCGAEKGSEMSGESTEMLGLFPGLEASTVEGHRCVNG